MTREQAIALIGEAVDYSRQRCRVLHSTDRRFDADAVRSEFAVSYTHLTLPTILLV